MATNEELMEKLDQVIVNQFSLMAKLDEIGKQLGNVETGPQEGDIKKTPFGNLQFKGGEWVTGPPVEVVKIPVIPNDEYDPPMVADARVKVLAWIEDKDGFGEWFSIWEASNTTSIARIEPWLQRDIDNMASCGKAPEAGTYTYHRLEKVRDGWTVVRKVGNPWLPIPEGCRIAADGYSLEDNC